MKILYGILLLIVLILLIAAILPKKMELSASTTIRASKDAVWEYVKILDNQRFYSVRVMKDPNVQLTYGGVDGTVGAKQARESTDKNVGKGEQEIIKMEEWTSYEVEIRFERPMVATNYAKTVVSEWPNEETIVTNTFWWVTPWPFNLISPFIAPKLRKDMQQNMDNLKAEVEKTN